MSISADARPSRQVKQNPGHRGAMACIIAGSQGLAALWLNPLHIFHETRGEPMKVVKKTDEYVIFEKRNKRHAVKSLSSKTFVNGDDKVKVLLEAGLIKLPEPKAAPAEEAPAEEAAAE
jgi:hypothetical protein